MRRRWVVDDLPMQDGGPPGAVDAGQSDDDEVQVNHSSAQLHGVRQSRPPVLREGVVPGHERANRCEFAEAEESVDRYFPAKPRPEITFDFQDVTRHIDTFTDSDWSGCHRTRKSTNGGCAMRGEHTIKTWSSTQGGISLSSGEAEYYGITKAGVVGLGIRSFFSDMHTDSTAAKGITTHSYGQDQAHGHPVFVDPAARRSE